MLSVIIPAYNEEAMIPIAAQEITRVLDEVGIDHELLFVDDGSRDGTWAAIEAASRQDRRVTGLHFSRNFGKEAALFAGLEQAKGDCCVTMDCDLQHPPEKLPAMVKLWEEGYEVVEGVKVDRGRESGSHRLAARIFYGLISKATGQDLANSSDFKLLDRKVVDALNRMPERGVFYRALSFWVGFKRTELPYRVQARPAGESKWSTRSLIRYAIRNIGSFSSAPLQIVTALGLLMLVTALVFSLVALVQKITGVAIGGFTTVIVLLLFTGSLIMISLGIIGFYLARIYEELKGRPRYIISETCGREDGE